MNMNSDIMNKNSDIINKNIQICFLINENFFFILH